MPAKFDKCVKGGGKIRTIKPSQDKYMPICIKGGKSIAGHVKVNKSKGK